MEHENINKQEDAQLGIGGVSISALTEWLKSESVYTALRYAAKNPSNSGMDNCEDRNYLHLYNLICQIRRH